MHCLRYPSYLFKLAVQKPFYCWPGIRHYGITCCVALLCSISSGSSFAAVFVNQNDNHYTNAHVIVGIRFCCNVYTSCYTRLLFRHHIYLAGSQAITGFDAFPKSLILNYFYEKTRNWLNSLFLSPSKSLYDNKKGRGF